MFPQRYWIDIQDWKIWKKPLKKKFLKNSTPVVFVESWKSVEKKVVARGKDTLTSSPEAKAIPEKLEKAEENYGMFSFLSSFS